jgi:hypothetical protein
MGAEMDLMAKIIQVGESILDEAPLYIWLSTANPRESMELLDGLKQDIIPLLSMFL